MLRKTGFGLVLSIMVFSFLFPVITVAQDIPIPPIPDDLPASEGSGSGVIQFPQNDANSEFPNTSSGGGTIPPVGPSTPTSPGNNPNSLSAGSIPTTPGNNPSSLPRFTSFQNPISANTIQEFIARILQFVVQLSVPFAVFFIILTGFRYVMAQGNPEKILEAHRTLLYTVIGIMVLLGAQLISLVIQNTIQQLR
jgi:hypothetical protein